MTISFRAALASVVACAAAFAFPAFVAAQAPTIPTFERDLRVGFNDAYKLGKWTELELTLVGGPAVATGEVYVETPDGSGAPTVTLPAQPIRLLPGQRLKVVVPVCLGGPDAPLKVTFKYKTDDGAVHVSTADFGSVDRSESLPPPLPNPSPVVLNLGPSIGLKEAVAKQKWAEESRPEVVMIESTESLPQRWYGYDCVDLVVLSSASPELYDALSDVQRQTLLEWVRRGGRVLISAGASAPQLFAAGRPLAELAPGQFDRIYQLTSSRAFEDYSEGSQRLFPSPETRLDVATFTGHQGKVVVSEKGAVPLVSRRAMNFGEITYIAVDMHNRLLLDWSGLGQFYNRLLSWRPLKEEKSTEDAANQAFMQQHVTDLATDLRISLEKFDVWPPPFLLVAAMILVYILLIGPGDYFFLKRLGRMELTWVTFPTIVVLVSIAAYWTARSSRGDKLKVNQINVVDVDVTAKLARGTTVANIFAPYSSTYDLALQTSLPLDAPAPTSTSTLLTWFGLPETRAFGGMGNPNTRPILGNTPYQLRPDAGTLDGAPILTASTKAFLARWTQPAELFEAKLTARTDKNAGEVLSNLTVTSRLNVRLAECVLYYNGECFDLDQIPANGTWSGLLSSLNRQSMTDRLTDMRQVVDPQRNTYVYQRKPYAVASGSREEVLTAMMFYESIEGADYTKLSNEYLRYLDLSHELESGRAILMAVPLPAKEGQVVQPAAQLTSGGKPISETAEVHDFTVYRFVVDVTKE